jgi:hypothetical protein
VAPRYWPSLKYLSIHARPEPILIPSQSSPPQSPPHRPPPQPLAPFSRPPNSSPPLLLAAGDCGRRCAIPSLASSSPFNPLPHTEAEQQCAPARRLHPRRLPDGTSSLPLICRPRRKQRPASSSPSLAAARQKQQLAASSSMLEVW